MNKFTLILISVILMIGLFWGCNKNNPSTTAPILPPTGSMSIDFSNFVSTSKSGDSYTDINGMNAIDKSNWALASTSAGVWNLILAVNLLVPVASFNLAVNNTPVYLDNNNTWEWRYSFNVIGGSYKARLTGQVRSNDVKWEMYITKEGVGAFSEILWYEGTSKLDGTSGQWVLNHSQQFPEPMLQIDWVAQGSSIRNIKYTYIRDKNDDRSADLFKTSFIEYGLTTNDLNAFYTIHQNTGVVNVFSDTFIEWNTTNHTGHIKANYHYQDMLWHCWNATLDNIICN